ncbi:hypothetical protein KIN20_022339 [Parelaphostrongylus tenuis]|uniref:Uncharacterized protein n=1 Tax=Parelaphostrongylus tenuis TaxID=148309 RepID=A0AAD5MVC8_PARTN|nr:hypothetical protein KIN20_022339 [Parelaphostrongylus tenuis]
MEILNLECDDGSIDIDHTMGLVSGGAEPTLYELSDICGSLFGQRGRILAVSFSVLVLTGAVLAYWVLMSNFLYFTGILLYAHCKMDVGSLSLVNLDASPSVFGLTFADIWQLRLNRANLLGCNDVSAIEFQVTNSFH